MKIDIPGYENMTVEEKLKALEGYEPDMSGFVSKAVFDKTASEAANYKKQLRDKLTDEEQRAAREAEEREKLMARVQELERDKKVADLTSKYMSLGFDSAVALKTATSHVDGDFDKVFANFKSLIDSREKTIRAEMLKSTPEPQVGGVETAMTLEALQKMSPTERLQFSIDHPDQYKQLYGGNK